MVTKTTGLMLPVTQELLDDSVLDIGRFVRGAFLYQTALMDGRIEVRGGGWYRLDDVQFRGHWQVRDELIRLADEAKK